MIKFAVMADPECNELQQNYIRYCNRPNDIGKLAAQIIQAGAQGNVHVYQICELHKVIEAPKFAAYIVNNDLEVLPKK